MVEGIRNAGLHLAYANEQETVRAGSGKLSGYKVNHVFYIANNTVGIGHN